MRHELLAAYLALFLGTMLMKAWRYRLLLAAGGPGNAPGLADLLTVSLASNLFVDLLPGRVGGLAYVAILNRRFAVQLAACFSSLAFSVIFDLLGMLPLLALAIAWQGLLAGGSHPLLWGLLAALALAGTLALIFLGPVLVLAGRLLEWLAGRLSGRPAAGAARVAREARAVVQDVALVRARGVFGRVLLVSLLARLCKYGGLYVLVLALAWPWPPEVRAVLSFPLVLFSLLAAEATASLPISGVAGFGAYEGVMMVALGQAGLSATQAALLPFGLHLLTQTLDYLLGGLALVKLSLGRREPPPAP